MLVLDNPQATSWLTGILEGEGSCAGVGTQAKRTYIRITNTDVDIINKCLKVLDILHLFPTTTYHRPKDIKRKAIHNVCINSKHECEILLRTLGSSFQCRLQEFERKLGSSTTTRDRPLTVDKFWLVGVFEAEGHLSLECDANNYYNPVIGFKNTNERIRDKYCITLNTLDIQYRISTYKDGNPLHAREYAIRTRGLKRCDNFLRKLRELFQTTKYSKRAELLYTFCRSRLMKNQQEPYSEAEHQIYRELKVKI